METRKLHEFFDELIVGETLNRKAEYVEEYQDGCLKVLTTKAICEGYIDDKEIGVYRLLEDKKPIKENKFTKEYDVVVKLTPPYSAVVIDLDHTGLLVPQFCLILRKNQPTYKTRNFRSFSDELVDKMVIDIPYITTYINSNLFRDYAGKLELSDIRSISKTIIGNCNVPDCTELMKERISQSFEYLSNSIRLTRKLIGYQEEYMDALFDIAIHDDISDDIKDMVIEEDDEFMNELKNRRKNNG